MLSFLINVLIIKRDYITDRFKSFSKSDDYLKEKGLKEVYIFIFVVFN